MEPLVARSSLLLWRRRRFALGTEFVAVSTLANHKKEIFL